MHRHTTALLAVLLATTPLLAQGKKDKKGSHDEVRFATFNCSLNRGSEGQLISDLEADTNAQARVIAEILQRTDADVVLLNEFDYDAKGEAVDLFRKNYLAKGWNGAKPVSYPYAFSAESNTGILSGKDLNNDGKVELPDDAYGFGFFPGQYGMVLLSKYPIDEKHSRTFQKFLWKDMPGARLPDDSTTTPKGDYYSADELAIFRLSSKSHWDVAVRVGPTTVHVLCAHPTPPVFDGPEDRNGLRNHDEIRFWADYVTPGKGWYIKDDAGGRGGLHGSRFVILGDYNADPYDGDSVDQAAQQLLENRWINTTRPPSSEGAVEAAKRQGGANDSHKGDPALDTADFADGAPGNLRVDFVLPSRTMTIVDSAVFWPEKDDPLFRLVGDFPFPSSDHRLVWIDVLTRRPQKWWWCWPKR